MTAHIPSIGAAVASIEKGVLSIGLGSVKGLSKGLGFAAQLDKKLENIGDGSDIISQLAGLLQTGVPVTSTLAGKVTAQLAQIIAKASGKANDAGAQRTLQRALANALAPPGTSPPSPATLVRRIEDILNTLTSQLSTAGQKSEFSGKILDAAQAKETPAPQTPPPTGTSATPAAVTAFVQSLVNQAAAPAASGLPALTIQAQTAPALPDPLARILARAAKADVQRGGEPVTRTLTPGSRSSGTAPASVLFTRLIAIVAGHGGAQGGNGDVKSSQEPNLPAAATPAAASQPPADAPPSTQFQAQLASAPASSGHAQYATATTTPAQAPVHYTAVDPQTVIEQVVKGIVLRNSGDTSEVRMRLQPEHLGDVSLKLSVTGNTITASIVAQNADVRDMLLSNQQQLVRTLSQAGLSLGGFSVDVSGGNGGFTQQRSQQQTRLARTGAFAAALTGEDDTWADPRFGPPIVSGSKSIVLDYLA